MTDIRFAAKIVEQLCDSVRGEVEKFRGHERKLQELMVLKCHMPRDYFLKLFPEKSMDLKWVDKIAAAKPHSDTFCQEPPGLGRTSGSADRSAEEGQPAAAGLQGHLQADVLRRKPSRARRRKRMTEANLRLVISIAKEVHQPRPAVPRPHPGRQHRPDEGGGQVRIPAAATSSRPTPRGGSVRPSPARSPTRRAPSASRCT